MIEDTLPGTQSALGPIGRSSIPLDYIEVLERGVPQALEHAGAEPGRVIGLGRRRHLLHGAAQRQPTAHPCV